MPPKKWFRIRRGLKTINEVEAGTAALTDSLIASSGLKDLPDADFGYNGVPWGRL